MVYHAHGCLPRIHVQQPAFSLNKNITTANEVLICRCLASCQKATRDQTLSLNRVGDIRPSHSIPKHSRTHFGSAWVTRSSRYLGQGLDLTLEVKFLAGKMLHIETLIWVITFNHLKFFEYFHSTLHFFTREKPVKMLAILGGFQTLQWERIHHYKSPFKDWFLNLLPWKHRKFEFWGAPKQYAHLAFVFFRSMYTHTHTYIYIHIHINMYIMCLSKWTFPPNIQYMCGNETMETTTKRLHFQNSVLGVFFFRIQGQFQVLWSFVSGGRCISLNKITN